MISRPSPISRLLVLVFAIVGSRWIEMKTGWADAVVLPLAALAGVVLLDLAALPSQARLDLRGWILNAAAALGLGMFVRVLAG
jgi:hypothetical protein